MLTAKEAALLAKETRDPDSLRRKEIEKEIKDAAEKGYRSLNFTYLSSSDANWLRDFGYTVNFRLSSFSGIYEYFVRW